MSRATAAETMIARIRAAVAAIPPGETCSYGIVALRAGAPGRARLVGRVLREAPAELQLPWHRVVRADGRLAFETGSEAWHRQTRLLADEGVQVRHGRVELRFRAQADTLDELLWRPPA